MKKILVAFIIIMLSISGFCVYADSNDTTFYVSINGNDNNSGNKSSPFLTIERAKQAVKGINKNMKNDIIVYIGGGTYELLETLNFTETDSGYNDFNVVYKAIDGQKPIISGGRKVTDLWKDEGNGIFSVKVTDVPHIRNIYINDKKLFQAKTAKKITFKDTYKNEKTDTIEGLIFDNDDIKNMKSVEGLKLHYTAAWVSYDLSATDIIDNKNGTSTIMFEPRMLNNSMSTYYPLKPGVRFNLQNSYVFLDEENEFYYDNKLDKLYVYSNNDINLNDSEIYIPYLEEVLSVKGSNMKNKVENLVFDGLSFCHGTWYDVSEHSFYALQAQRGGYNTQLDSYKIPANINISAAENIVFKNNHFYGFGTVALWLQNGVNNSQIVGNVFNDIADSAVVVGRINHDSIYNEGKYTNLAFEKPILTTAPWDWSSDFSKVNDGNIDSAWMSETDSKTIDENDNNKWLTIDLEKPYKIDEIELMANGASDPELRKNINIYLSNDIDFKEKVKIHSVSNEAYSETDGLKIKVDTKSEYRYIRVEKEGNGRFCISELSAFNYEMLAQGLEEHCKDNTINNNYITRVGDLNFSAPAITAYYVERLDISNNYIKDIPYTGISLGWGWHLTRSSVTCRENTIANNKIENYMTESFDGGGIYTLGDMPQTVIKNNYIKGGLNPYAAIYPDDGSGYLRIEDNVLEDIVGSYHLWISYVHDIDIKNTYTTSMHVNNNGTNCKVEPMKLFLPTVYNKEILDIIDNSGLQNEYKSIISKVPSYENYTAYGVEQFQTIQDELGISNLMSLLINPTVNSIKTAVSKIKIGNNIREFNQNTVANFNEKVDKIYKNTQKANVTKEKIIECYIELRNEYFKFIESRNKISFDELHNKALSELKKAKIGNEIGCYPKEYTDKLSSAIKEINAEDENSYNDLENEYIRFIEAKTELKLKNINSNELNGNYIVDYGSKSIFVPVKAGTDLSDLSIEFEFYGGKLTYESEKNTNYSTPVVLTVKNDLADDYIQYKVYAILKK